MELKVIKPFSWAHEHVRIKSYDKDEVIDTKDEDLIRVSLHEKWTTKKRGSDTSAQTNAPEHSALSAAPENKQPPAESSGDIGAEAGTGSAD